MESIYKHFNDMEVDMEKINSIEAELDNVTKKRIKNNLKNSIKAQEHKRFTKTGVIAAAVSLLLLGYSIIPQSTIAAFAENIPVINTLFEKFGLGYGGGFQDYTQVVGMVEEDEGYEVKLDEVVMDDFSFKFIYTIRCPEKVSDLIGQEGNPFPHTPYKSIRLKGKEISGGAGGDYRIIDDYTIQVIEDYDIYDMDLPNSFNVEIDFRDINRIAGDWKFSFHLSREKVARDIQNYSPNKQIQIENSSGKEVTLTFEKISFSPISTAILIDSNNEFYHGDLVFKDEYGNIIVSSGSSFRAHDGIFGYKATSLYKLKPMQKIPNRIFVEYRNKGKINSSEIELTSDK